MTITASLSTHTDLVSAHVRDGTHLYFKDQVGTAALWLHGVPNGVASATADAFNAAMKAQVPEAEVAA